MPSTLLDSPPAATPVKWPTDVLVTGEDLLRHPEWGPCELIKGKVLPVCRPNNQHGMLVQRISMRVGNFVEQRKLGRCFVGDSGVFLQRDPDTVRGPDFHYVRNDRWPGSSALKTYLTIAPDLCIEIVSPNDTWNDIEDEVAQFQAIGVGLFWVIDPKSRSARVYKNDGHVIVIPSTGALAGDDVLPGFTLALTDLFSVLD